MKFNMILKEILQQLEQTMEDTALFLNLQTEHVKKYQENEPIPVKTLSRILEKLELKIIENTQNNYIIVPITMKPLVTKKEFLNFNGVLKNIRKNAKMNQTDFGKVFDKKLLAISRCEVGTANPKTTFIETVMEKMNATLEVDTNLLRKHFHEMQMRVPFSQNETLSFSDRFEGWNISQSGGYNYLFDGLVFSKNLKKNILVSVSPESICVFRTPRKSSLNCTSLPSKSAFLKEHKIAAGSVELAKTEIVIACLNKDLQMEKTHHFYSFFDEKDFEFLSYLSANMNELIAV